MKELIKRSLSGFVVFTVVLTMLFCVQFGSEAYAVGNSSNWTGWATQNQNGVDVGPIYTPNPTNALKGRYQDGYGLVNLNLGFRTSDGNVNWTRSITNNSAGNELAPVQCPFRETATGIEVREQRGYGLVDARLTCSGNVSTTPWLSNNYNGENLFLKAQQITGMEAREQIGYGLINLRVRS